MNTTERGERPKTSQRVLVGMVAVLGLSLWGWPAIATGFSAFRWWMVERLAEWDTWRPGRRDCILVAERPDPSPWEVSQGAARPARSSERPILRGAVHPEASEREGGEPRIVQVTFPAAGAASLELRLAVELCQFASGAEVDPTIPSGSSRPQPVLVASNPVDDIFEENPDGYEPAEEASASQTSSRPLATTAGPSFEMAEPFEDEYAFVADWVRWDDEVAQDRGLPSASSVVRRTFEPIVVAEDLEEGLAYELNRASEGIGIVAPEAREVRGRKPAHSSSAAIDELGRAIALTRDAARAWMDVLTGTTTVRVTSR